jgi:hypothetical protein
VTPEEGGDLVERLLPIAARIACVVNGDGDRHDIDHHTKRLDRQELIALVVLLGAMVDPNARVDDALGFITWDEHGRPAPPKVHGRLTIRSLGYDVEGPTTLGAERVLRSEQVQLARELHLGQGFTITEVARQLGVGPKTVQKWAGEWAA